MTEQELAAQVVNWLKHQEWDVYQEVELHGRVADIVAVKDGRTWVIETKLSLSIAVIEQAEYWRAFANWSSVAVPWCKGRSRFMAERIMRWLGIGAIYVAPRGDVDRCSILSPAINRIRSSYNISKFLNEAQRDWAPAGNPDGKRWTPFAQTCLRLREFVAGHDGCSMKDAIAGISHHYHKDTTATACLRKWVDLGKVSGVRSEILSGKIRLHAF